jgi:two-component system, LytTR family, response regulator
MIHCLIVDDEQTSLDVLIYYISRTPVLKLVKAVTNPMEVLEIVNREKIDLVFLDIQMPEVTGLDLARTIQDKCRIIITTAYHEFAVESYELQVADYLLKPVPLPRFLKAVQRVLNMSHHPDMPLPPNDTIEHDYMYVKTEAKGKMQKINLSDIMYVEAMGNYLAIHHGGTRTMAFLNMKDIELRLPQKYFIRVHKSFIVAINRIATVAGNSIILKGVDADIQVGDTYRKEFYSMMKQKLVE